MYRHNYNAQKGAAMLFFMVFFVIASSALTFTLSRTIASDLFTIRSLITSKQAYIVAESALEDVVYRTMSGGYTLGAEETLQLTGQATTTITYDMPSDTYIFRSVGELGAAQRVGVVELTLGAGSAFNYGIQTGNGGFSLVNSASVIGNIYSNGPIVGGGSSLIDGDVISAGPTGFIDRIRAGGTTRSQTLSRSTVDGDAYYNAQSGTNNVAGTRYSPFTVEEPIPLPIPETEIDEWLDTIDATGSVIPATACPSGTYTINSNAELGNVKIECNLIVSGNGTLLTLTGPVWVTGNIEFQQGPTVRVAPSLGRRSVQVIADNPTDRLTSSIIQIRNGSNFLGSGHPASFIMVLSRNNSGANGGSQVAISIAQSSAGELILYTNEGIVDVANNISASTITGHEIKINNNSQIVYETGLANTLFTGGPGGGYVISAWYQE